MAHTREDTQRVARPAALLILAGLAMAYGWGYRGIVGHEGGAMVPGALLGMAVCLAAGRRDWYQRSAVAGLFGAAGWAWGGSMSYMEQTMYTVSDALPDVFYGYAILFFMGALWAGIGGAVLGMGLTLPRSVLQHLAKPFAAIGAVYLLVYLYLFFDRGTRDIIERYSAQHFHDGDFFAATIALAVSLIYVLATRDGKREAWLFVWAAIAWFAGYLTLTKFGGIHLGPPYRSESWGGVLGVLIALIIYLKRTGNRAAILLSLYGILGGGLAFALAVFIRHPVRVGWGPFASWGGMLQWKIAEESFGLLMGLAIALGVYRLLREGLAPPEEDAPRKPLDIFAAFVVIVVLLWMNVRRTPMRWIDRYDAISHNPVAGLAPWAWYVVFGLLLSALALFALRRYARDALAIAPKSSFGKGAFLFLLLMWTTLATGFTMDLPAARNGGHPLVELTFMLLAGGATACLLMLGSPPPLAPSTGRPYSATSWKPSPRFYLTSVIVVPVLLVISLLSMAMQEGPAPGARLRFGPDAYWRDAMAVMGRWDVVGRCDKPGGDIDETHKVWMVSIEFARDRSAITTDAKGTRNMDAHRWYHADSRIHLDWQGRNPDHPDAATVVMHVENGNLYIPWPPSKNGGQYLALRPAM